MKKNNSIIDDIKANSFREFNLNEINIDDLILNIGFNSVQYLNLEDNMLYETKSLNLVEDKFSKPFKLIKIHSHPNLQGRVISYKDGVLFFHDKKPPYNIKTKIDILRKSYFLPKNLRFDISLSFSNQEEYLHANLRLDYNGVVPRLYFLDNMNINLLKYCGDGFNYIYSKNSRKIFISNEEIFKGSYFELDSYNLRHNEEEKFIPEIIILNGDKLKVSFSKICLDTIFEEKHEISKSSKVYSFIDSKDNYVFNYLYSVSKKKNNYYILNKNNYNNSLVNLLKDYYNDRGLLFSKNTDVVLSGYLDFNWSMSTYNAPADIFNYLLIEHPFKLNLNQLINSSIKKDELKAIDTIIKKNYGLIFLDNDRELNIKKEDIINVIDLDCLNNDTDHSVILNTMKTIKDETILKKKCS